MEYVLSRKHKTEVNFVLGLQGNMSKMINKEAETQSNFSIRYLTLAKKMLKDNFKKKTISQARNKLLTNFQRLKSTTMLLQLLMSAYFFYHFVTVKVTTISIVVFHYCSIL